MRCYTLRPFRAVALAAVLLAFNARADVDISLPPPVTPNELQIAEEITAEEAQVFIARLAGADPHKEILIRFNTPGGDLGSALLIAQAIESTVRRGGHIRCLVDGYALSAGLYILESCPVRQMTDRSVLMAHEPWLGISGPVTRLTAGLIAAQLLTTRRQYAAQCAARMRISVREFIRKIDGKQWWIGPEEALAVGAVDAVVPSPNVSL